MKKILEKIKSLDKGTIFRTISLILAIANQVVAVIGATSYASSPIYQTVSIILTTITTVIAAWYNNDFTYFAQLTTEVLKALKDGRIDENEVKELLDKAQGKKNTEEEIKDETDN